MTNRDLSINADQAIGLFGLLLMLVVARLANRGYSVPDGPGRSEDLRRPSGGLSGFPARRAIDSVALVGWLADHLPQSASNGGM